MIDKPVRWPVNLSIGMPHRKKTPHKKETEKQHPEKPQPETKIMAEENPQPTPENPGVSVPVGVDKSSEQFKGVGGEFDEASERNFGVAVNDPKFAELAKDGHTIHSPDPTKDSPTVIGEKAAEEPSNGGSQK